MYSISSSFQTSLPHFESGLEAWYYSYSSIHIPPSQCGSQLSIMGKVGGRVALSPLHSSGCVSVRSTGDGSIGIIMYQSMSALLYLGKSHYLWDLGVECFQPLWDLSGELCVPSCIRYPSSVQVSWITCHSSIQTSYSGGALLDGGSLASHSSWHVGRHSFLVFCHKNCHGYFRRQGAQGSAITAFIHLPDQRCLL